MTCWN